MLFGCIDEGNQHPIEDDLAVGGMVAIMIPAMLIGEVHKALQGIGHGLSDDVLKKSPKPIALNDVT